MNIQVLKCALLFAALLVGLALTGCETTSTATTRTAVGCEKCETIWIPKAGSFKAVGYNISKRMVCPDCVTAVENYFKTGELQHTCPSCGGVLKHCTAH